jgi:hypothetical protein
VSKIKEIDLIIKKAVDAGIKAGRRETEQKPIDAYRATERRLYALPDVKDMVAKDKVYLQDIQANGLHGHSRDLIRFKRAGRRMTDDEILEAMIQDLEAKIAANEHEINIVEDALAPLTSDPYFRAISGRYFDQISDDEIAKEIPCDPRTVRRNRGRLVRRVAVRLYGVDAV